jgi:hypothetical protein
MKRHSKRGKRWKGQGGSKMANTLSMYSITENIYCSQLSFVALLLQPERNCFISYNTRKWLGSLSLRAIVLRSSPPSHVSTCNGQRSSQLFCVHYTCYNLPTLKGTPLLWVPRPKLGSNWTDGQQYSLWKLFPFRPRKASSNAGKYGEHISMNITEV